MHTLQQYDAQLLELINYDGSLFTDNFWYLFTNKTCWVLAVVAIIFTVWRRSHRWKEVLAVILTFTALVVLTDWFPAHYIRPFFARPRPSHTEGLENLLYYVNDYRGGAYGFFSNHASNAFGIVTLIVLLFRTRWMAVVGYVWATMLCYSRLYLGVHFPGDILAGALWGVATAFFLFKAYKVIHKRMEKHHRWPTIEQTYRTGEPWLVIGTVSGTAALIFVVSIVMTLFEVGV